MVICCFVTLCEISCLDFFWFGIFLYTVMAMSCADFNELVLFAHNYLFLTWRGLPDQMICLFMSWFKQWHNKFDALFDFNGSITGDDVKGLSQLVYWPQGFKKVTLAYGLRVDTSGFDCVQLRGGKGAGGFSRLRQSEQTWEWSREWKSWSISEHYINTYSRNRTPFHLAAHTKKVILTCLADFFHITTFVHRLCSTCSEFKNVKCYLETMHESDSDASPVFHQTAQTSDRSLFWWL